MPTLKDDWAFAQEAASKAGRDPSKLRLTLEAAGMLTADGLDRAAEGLGRLKEMGVFHAILAVHPREMANAAPLFEAFAAKHLKALQG